MWSDFEDEDPENNVNDERKLSIVTDTAANDESLPKSLKQQRKKSVMSYGI